MATTKSAAKAQATTQPSVILERANKALQTTVVGIEKTISDLQAMVQASEALAIRIEDQNAESAALAAANEETRRSAAAELRLQLKEDREAVTDGLLKEAGLARITQAEVDSLRADLAAKVASDDAELKKAVAVAVQAANRDAQAVAAQKEADVRVAVAQKDAQIVNLTEKNAFLTQQIAQANLTIEAERQTRLEIAKADAQRQGVVVNNGK